MTRKWLAASAALLLMLCAAGTGFAADTQDAQGLSPVIVTLADPGWGMTIGQLLEQTNSSSDTHVYFTKDRASWIAESSMACTGMVVKDANGSNRDVVVRGDVNGTGKVDLSQLVRLAKVVKGDDTLEGPYFLAGDLTSDGRISISDVVAEARLFVQATQQTR